MIKKKVAHFFGYYVTSYVLCFVKLLYKYNSNKMTMSIPAIKKTWNKLKSAERAWAHQVIRNRPMQYANLMVERFPDKYSLEDRPNIHKVINLRYYDADIIKDLEIVTEEFKNS